MKVFTSVKFLAKQKRNRRDRTHLAVFVGYIFFDDVCSVLGQQVFDRLGIQRAVDERMPEQILTVGPFLRVLRQRFEDEIVKFLWPFGWLLQFRRIRFLNLQQHPHRRHLVVGRLHLREFYQSHAHRPDIHFEIIRIIAERLTENDFRRHPVGRPYESVVLL